MNNSAILNNESIGESIELFDRELNDLKRQVNDGYLKNKPDEGVCLFRFQTHRIEYIFSHSLNHVLHNLQPFASK